MSDGKIKILLVGGGGREHALAWKLTASPRCAEIVAAPGNPGLETLPSVRCLPVKADDRAALVALARQEKIDLVVCGPEGPLAEGLGDAMSSAGLLFFGPSGAAAEIEGSKAFAKRLMADAGVPTARFGVFDDVGAAERHIEAQSGPVVVKADGLCAGKGVVVASTVAEAKAAVRAMLAEGAFGSAGARVVIEERLQGREVSMMALCDGESLALLASSEDHKAVFDGDRGPNTGGMGTYSPSPLVDASLERRIVDEIFKPTVAALRRAGRPFRGLLYGGLMLTADGPKVIEWNCRFGDPETQSVLLRLEDDLLPWLEGAAAGRLPSGTLRFAEDAAVCVVLAAAGYPSPPRLGDAIHGIAGSRGGTTSGTVAHRRAAESDVIAFHAGTRRDGERIVTAGGRVLGIAARGPSLEGARERVYDVIGDGPGQIGFPGMHFRRDIGRRGQA